MPAICCRSRPQGSPSAQLWERQLQVPTGHQLDSSDLALLSSPPHLRSFKILLQQGGMDNLILLMADGSLALTKQSILKQQRDSEASHEHVFLEYSSPPSSACPYLLQTASGRWVGTSQEHQKEMKHPPFFLLLPTFDPEEGASPPLPNDSMLTSPLSDEKASFHRIPAVFIKAYLYRLRGVGPVQKPPGATL